MRKTILFASLLVFLVLLVGCASNESEGFKTKEKAYKKEIQVLKKENERMRSLTESEPEEEISSEKDTNDHEIQQVVNAFLSSEFAYSDSKERIQKMKRYTTKDFSNLLENEAVYTQEESSISILSEIEKVEIYQIKQDSESIQVVCRITTRFKVEQQEANSNHMLIELELTKENGQLKVEQQEIYNIT